MISADISIRGLARDVIEHDNALTNQEKITYVGLSKSQTNKKDREDSCRASYVHYSVTPQVTASQQLNQFLDCCPVMFVRNTGRRQRVGKIKS